MSYMTELRMAFMAGSTRHTNWERYSSDRGHNLAYIEKDARTAFMAGSTRHTNWERFSKT